VTRIRSARPGAASRAPTDWEALEAVRAGGRYRIEAEDIGHALEEKVLESVVHDIFGYPARWRALPEPVRQVLRMLADKTAGERASLTTIPPR
jgi:hypothetical protein